MKIRAGFVSNSSSASYTIVINETMEEFMKVMTTDCSYPYMKVNYILKRIRNNIKYLNERLEIANQHTGQVFYESITYLENRKTELQNKLKIVENIRTKIYENGHRVSISDSKQLFDIIAELSYVELEHKESMVTLTSKTAMHNNFHDIPDLMREIILFYTFHRPQQIVASVKYK